MDHRQEKSKFIPTKKVVEYKESRINTPTRSINVSSSPYSNKDQSPNSSSNKPGMNHSKILQYQQKIANLQNTIASLQKLNKTIMYEAKSNQSQLEYLLQCTREQLNKKTNKVHYLEETISKMNIRMFETNSQNHLCQSARSRASNSRRNTQQNLSKSRQKIILTQHKGNSERVITELKKQLENMKKLMDQKNSQIAIFKQNLKQKQQLTKKNQDEYETLKNELQNKIKLYQNVINEKQLTIRKMAQFNDDICSKLMQQNSNPLTKTEKKKLQLLLHDNKTLKQRCYELQNKNLELEEEISNFVNKCKDMKGIRQEILLIIDNQKKIITKKNMEIQALKYQIMQLKKELTQEKQIKNTKASPRLKESTSQNKSYSHNTKVKTTQDFDEPQIQQFQSTCDNQSGHQRQKNIELFQQNFEKFRKLYNYVSKNQMIQECPQQDQPFINDLIYKSHEKDSNDNSSPRFSSHLKVGSKVDVRSNQESLKKRSHSIKDPQNLTFAFDDTVQMPDDYEN